MNVLMALASEVTHSETAWDIFTNPAHIIAELGWTLIQDVILVWLLYGTLWKKVILPRLHEKFDKEHKIVHHEEQVEDAPNDHKHDGHSHSI